MPQPNRFPALPPPPDPETGEPFPPPGRARVKEDLRPELDRNRETRLSHKPKPPPGLGPVLIWHKQNVRYKVVFYVGFVALVLAGVSLVSFIEGDGGFDWVPYWQIWVGIALFSLLPTAPLTYWVHAAGSDWYMYEIVKFRVVRRKVYVHLYELKEIRCEFAFSGWHLQLTDQRGKGTDVPLIDYQQDRRIWALIYNGILHSAAAGAMMDDVTIKKLELDQVPELYNPTGAETADSQPVDDQPGVVKRVDRPDRR